MADDSSQTESTATPSKQNLLTVPPEVCERIAQQAKPRDLLSLRLVSKETSARVFRTYTKAHFTERAFLLYSEDSLTTLLEIAESDTLAPLMRKVILCVDELPGPDVDRLPYDHSTSIPPAEAHILARSQLSQRKSLYEQQWHFRSRHLLPLLTLIFARFRQTQNLVSVGITTCHVEMFTGRSPRLFNTLQAEVGMKLVLPMKPDFFEIIVDALASSDLQIRELENTSGDASIPAYDLQPPEKTLANTRTVFERLRRLRLYIASEESPTYSQREALGDMLQNMPDLEQLELFFEGDDQNEPMHMGMPFLQTTFPALKKIWLFNWAFSYPSLVDFLRLQTKLERATFDACLFHQTYDDIALDARARALEVDGGVSCVVVENNKRYDSFGASWTVDTDRIPRYDEATDADDSDGSGA